MDAAYFRCVCGETIEGEAVVDPMWATRVAAHKATCVAAAFQIERGTAVRVTFRGEGQVADAIFKKVSGTGHRVVEIDGRIVALDPNDDMVLIPAT
jgi:hypothetical protein